MEAPSGPGAAIKVKNEEGLEEEEQGELDQRWPSAPAAARAAIADDPDADGPAGSPEDAARPSRRPRRAAAAASGAVSRWHCVYENRKQRGPAWTTRVKIPGGKWVGLGTYDVEKDAVKLQDYASIALLGRNAITNMCYEVQEEDGSVFETGPGTAGQHSASYVNRTYSGWQEVLDGRRAAEHVILSDAKVEIAARRPELSAYLGAGPRRPPVSRSLPAATSRSLPFEKRASKKARKKGPNDPPEERNWLGVRMIGDEEIAAFLRMRDGGSLCLGSGFSTEEEAARFRDLAAICLDGGEAITNFPFELEEEDGSLRRLGPGTERQPPDTVYIPSGCTFSGWKEVAKGLREGKRVHERVSLEEIRATNPFAYLLASGDAALDEEGGHEGRPGGPEDELEVDWDDGSESFSDDDESPESSQEDRPLAHRIAEKRLANQAEGPTKRPRPEPLLPHNSVNPRPPTAALGRSAGAQLLLPQPQISSGAAARAGAQSQGAGAAAAAQGSRGQEAAAAALSPPPPLLPPESSDPLKGLDFLRGLVFFLAHYESVVDHEIRKRLAKVRLHFQLGRDSPVESLQYIVDESSAVLSQSAAEGWEGSVTARRVGEAVVTAMDAYSL